ncbi:Phosphoadenosine phosphosulfate reductase [Neolecta irregularis DAH-3]|uniref:Phosphoadenosine phosphosulfate reductase n=1 Tax=Neolecta irregularis (strain DAH-3) TaxID=1198029 RepID=A0A1U7LJE7_NEOID|nr:Phosphoadenosine phosphosulfate reductase [Neolecta irregularis DAH-3]|eukprot:OLL22672.1 Phosphoadenosine phosphosulfate reductase [Neolecta irregularis DAH-3]
MAASLMFNSCLSNSDYLSSGYISAVNSIAFTKSHLKFLNDRLATLEPRQILQWCTVTLPNLYQTTAFGLTGLVTIDMLSTLQDPPPLIFLDTLHHFQETLLLIEKIKARYPQISLNIYKPNGLDTTFEFNKLYGERLWEKDEALYDYTVKVEPARRAYRELGVKAVLTGRRKSQGGARSNLDIIEIDDTGLVKVNPFANWSFRQVYDYIREFKVPYNELSDQGYRSIGDWHSTVTVKDDEDERAGRWKGQVKTECGLHENYFKMKLERLGLTK